MADARIQYGVDLLRSAALFHSDESGRKFCANSPEIGFLRDGIPNIVASFLRFLFAIVNSAHKDTKKF